MQALHAVGRNDACAARGNAHQQIVQTEDLTAATQLRRWHAQQGKSMLSVVVEPDGDVVYVHADLEGLEALERSISALRRHVAQGECEHEHFFSAAWGGSELTETMLEHERTDGCTQAHHFKLCGWTEEWAVKHGLLPSTL